MFAAHAATSAHGRMLQARPADRKAVAYPAVRGETAAVS